MRAFVAIVLVVASVGLGAARLAGMALPAVSEDRIVLLAVAGFGLAACALGGVGRAVTALGWSHPLTVFGSALGVGALAIVAVALWGGVAGLDDRVAILVLAGLVVLKTLVTLAWRAIGGPVRRAAPSRAV